MQQRVKLLIIALLGRFGLPEYVPTEVSCRFQIFFQVVIEFDNVEQFTNICAACILPCCLEEFGGNDWRKL